MIVARIVARIVGALPSPESDDFRPSFLTGKTLERELISQISLGNSADLLH